jgi:hypothetical protein
MLRKSTKLLLAIEVVACFAPSLLLLLVGALLVPLQIGGILEEPLIWQGPASLIGSVICGVAGLFALGFVMSKLLGSAGSIGRPALICAGVTLGILPIAPYALFGDHWAWRIVGIAPIAVSAHLLFLSRRLLFPSWREVRRSTIVASAIAITIPAALILNPFATWRSTVRDQRLRWEKAAPDRYEYTVVLSGWLGPEEFNPTRITVESGAVVSASYVWDVPGHKAGDPAPVEGLWTMERVFTEIAAAQDRGWTVSARFNERWGFVERAFTDSHESSSGWDVEVKNFREGGRADP